MPLLVDGNNLLHGLNLGRSSRTAVRRLVLDACRHERRRVTVVFDGPPPGGAPSRESLGAVTVVYSGAAAADDVIVRQLPAGREARDWVVVTDDRGLQRRARERGAEVRSLADWRRHRLARPRRQAPESKLSSREVAEWEDYFRREPEDG